MAATALAGDFPPPLQGAQREKTLWRLKETIRTIDEHAPGITSDEYKAFLFIAEHENAAAKDVQNALGLPQSTASRTIARLNGGVHGQEGLGLIQSETDPESRRRIRIKLSEKGRALLCRLSVIVGCLFAVTLDDVTEDPDIGQARYFGSLVTEHQDDRINLPGRIITTKQA